MKIAVYCTADRHYLFPAIIALKSIMRFEECDAFILSGEMDAWDVAELDNYGIGYVHTDKHHHFKNGKWPNVTFLQQAGPEIFYELGYDFSLGIDADVFCDKPLNLPYIFDKTEFYAGVVNQNPRKSNFYRPKYIQIKYGITDEEMEGENTNCGVVFWNNKAAHEYGLWQRCLDLWEEGEFIAVDQSLFALVSVGLPFHRLPRGYNFRVGNKSDMLERCDDIRIYHWTGVKPWEGDVKYGEKWSEFVRNIGY